MADKETDIMKLSPHELIQPFAKTKIWQFLVIAIVAHVVLVGITSIGYIKRTITGEPPPAAKEPAEPEPAPQTTTAPQTQPEATAPDADSPEAQHDAMMEQHKDTKVMQDITEAASPDEIPDEPDDIGISIDDTNID